MTIEEGILRIAVALEAIAKNGGSLAQIAAAASTGAAAADTATAKAGKGKPAAAAAETKVEGPKWSDVVPKIQGMNKALGREAVLELLKAFGLDPDKNQTVPALEKVGKNAEIIAWVDKKMTPAADAGEVDLGI